MMSMFKKNVSYNERSLRRKITAKKLWYALKNYTKSQVKNLLESMDSSSFIKLLEQCHYEQFVSRDDGELLRMAIEKGLNVNFKFNQEEPLICYAFFHGKMGIVKELFSTDTSNVNILGPLLTFNKLWFTLNLGTKNQVKNLLESTDSPSFMKILHQVHYGELVSRDDGELLRMAIEKGLNVNFKFNQEVPLISYAFFHGKIEIVKELLSTDTLNLNIKPYKLSATYQAIALAEEKKDFSVLELLVDTNKINQKFYGVDYVNSQMLVFLIDKSPKILGKFLRSSNELPYLNEPINGFPPLGMAIATYKDMLKSGDKTSADLLFESIKVLVADKRVDVNYTNGTTIPKPLLSVALRKGLIDLAALLIRCERTNLQKLSIPSTFDWAIDNKHDDVICALLSRKDVQIDEKTKSNVFDYALNNKEQDLIKLILRYISNINNDDIIERLFDYAISINDEMVLLVLDNVKKLKDGEIARLFNYAIKNHSIKIVESILSRLKKTVDRKIIVSFNNLSDTAEKHSALKLGRIALRPFVVEYVSTRKTILARLMNFQDPRGEAVAHKIARQILSGDEDLLNIPGVNVNQVNNEEDPPLFVAIKAQNKWCIEFLLKRTDVNVNFVNLRNKSPLMLAIESTQTDVAKLIINHQRFTTVRDCELAAAINLSQIDVLKDLIATDKVSQATVFNQAIKQESVDVVSFCLGLFKQSNLFDDINWAKLTHVKSKKLKEILSNHLFQPLDEYIESLNSLMSNKMLDPIVIFRFGNTVYFCDGLNRVKAHYFKDNNNKGLKLKFDDGIPIFKSINKESSNGYLYCCEDDDPRLINHYDSIKGNLKRTGKIAKISFSEFPLTVESFKALFPQKGKPVTCDPVHLGLLRRIQRATRPGYKEVSPQPEPAAAISQKPPLKESNLKTSDEETEAPIMVIDSEFENKQQALSKYRQALDELALQKVQLELPLNAPNDDFKSQLKENLKTAWIELTEDSESSPIRVLPDAAGQRLDLSSIHLSTSDILKLTDTKKSGFNVNAKEFNPKYNVHARVFVPLDQEQAAGQASKEPAVIEAPAAGQPTSESAGQATLKSKRAAQFTIAKTLVDLFEKEKDDYLKKQNDELNKIRRELEEKITAAQNALIAFCDEQLLNIPSLDDIDLYLNVFAQDSSLQLASKDAKRKCHEKFSEAEFKIHGCKDQLSLFHYSRGVMETGKSTTIFFSKKESLEFACVAVGNHSTLDGKANSAAYQITEVMPGNTNLKVGQTIFIP